jgi:hypothetical protein
LPEKKKRFRLGCFALLIILVVFLLWFNHASMKVEKENHFRTRLMVTLRDQIEDHYKTHGEYPEDLLVMAVESKQLIKEYIGSGVFRYRRDPSGKQWYHLLGVYSGNLKMGGGKHNLSWSGIQYSNSPEQLSSMPGGYGEPDENGFYFVDLH